MISKTKTLLTALLLTGTMVAFGQTKISGTVLDEQGQPVPGANVSIKDTYDGTSTAPDGSYQFTSDEKGQQHLVVTFIGYKTFEQPITLAGTTVQITVILQEAINELEAVTISAGSFTASDQSRRTVFKALDIATTAGATADIAGALNTLPGTQKVGESGRLFVRGGDGNEARTFIDGMLVLDAYSVAAPNAPSRGRFLPFMFKGTSFSTGGYSAEYGQALSSALVLDSKDQESISRTDIGLLSVGADVTHTEAWDRASLSGKIQYTNIRPYFGLINQEIDWKTPPASWEGSAAYRQQVGKDGMLKIFGNFNHSNFSLYQHEIAEPENKQLYELTNDYRYINGAYKESIHKNWVIRGGVSYTQIKNKTELESIDIVEDDKASHTKIALEGSLSDKVEVTNGIESIQRHYQIKTDTSSRSLNFTETITAAFSEWELYASNKFVTRAGVRAEYNTLLQKVGIDPRVSLAYKTGDNSQVSLAYGSFKQSVAREYLRLDNSLEQEQANHYILNYQRIENNRTFRAELYHKEYENLLKYQEGSNGILYTNSGTGYARGFELFWRDNRSIKNVDYWLSYSYLDTKRNYLDFSNSVVPTFASAHNFSFVYKHFISKIKSQVGATYSFTSGRPYDNPNEAVRNASRTPMYADLSFNWSYLPTSNVIIHFSCTNVLGRDNIFGYEFSASPNENGLYDSRPIRQAAKRFLFLGVFITLSKEKTINQLPTL
jgi:hypothetical protein